jgi:hypothetical protein
VDGEALLARETEAWTSLSNILDSAPADRRTVEGVVPGWSVHDVVWHCVFWADWGAESLEMLNAGQEGEPPEPPESEILAHGRSLSWDEVLERAATARARVAAAVTATPEVTDRVREVIGGETYEHYDEHAAEISAFLGETG